MPMVMNWKSPPILKTRDQFEAYLQQYGVQVTVKQCHRVRSGKMNITVEGTPQSEMDFWSLVKEHEKQEIKKRGGK